MNFNLILSILTALSIVGCGSGSGSSQDSSDPNTVYKVSVSVADVSSLLAVGGTLFTVKDGAGDTVAAAGLPRVWNTYCQNATNELQFFVKGGQAPLPSIVNISKPNDDFHTGYGYTDETGIYAYDLAQGNAFRVSGQLDNGKVAWQTANFPCAFDKYSYGDFEYDQEYNPSSNSYIIACPKSGSACEKVAIAPGTYVYSYAPGVDSVLAITNYGDVLRYAKDSGWKRALRTGNTYTFPSTAVPMPTQPTVRQFYSSLILGNITLLGQWPDGQLYAYDGVSLSPWFGDRPKPQGEWGLEAQSMALYCGDLYVGYWPRGDLWKKSDGKWSFVDRFFTAPISRSPFVPYEPDYTQPYSTSFYGQRITALSNYGDSLYAFTSNLRQWYPSVDYSLVMSPAMAKEYGSVHRITNSSCGTGFVSKAENSQVLDFEITKDYLTVSSKSRQILKVKNASGFVPSNGDNLIIGDGIFGSNAKNLIQVKAN